MNLTLGALGVSLLLGLSPGAANAASSGSPALSPEDELTLIDSESPGMMNVLGRRLIDPSHWKRGSESGIWPVGDLWTFPEETVFDPQRPAYLGYGRPTLERFVDGTKATIQGSNHFPSIEDLKTVHTLTFYNAPDNMFWGYYSQQIWNNFPKEQHPLMYSLLDRGQTDQGALSDLLKLGVRDGRGVIRNEGDSSWSGKPWDTRLKSSIPYSQPEFNRMARNKILRPDISQRGADGISAKFWHPAGEQVPGLLEKLFSETHVKADQLKANRATLGSAYRNQAVALAADFYRQLVLIHPLWDGVGRTSKLTRDWVLRYMGLLPPSETPENDMELTTRQYAILLNKQIRETEKSYQLLAKDKQVIETLTKRNQCVLSELPKKLRLPSHSLNLSAAHP